MNIFEHIKGAHRENFVSDFYQTFLTEKVSKEVNKVVLEALLEAYHNTPHGKDSRNRFLIDLTQPFSLRMAIKLKVGLTAFIALPTKPTRLIW